MKIKNLLLLFLMISVISCTSKYITEVPATTKTRFGMEITTPTKAVFFVENENAAGTEEQLSEHRQIADKLYHQFGPATDNLYIARTNAQDLKFNLGNSTYYIDVGKLPHRTAMIVFDGKNKPVLIFESKKYEKVFLKNIKQ